MAGIKILDSETVNKIAAGEVVERPGSVVKELVENAIDAKATAVTIEIREGGVGLIRITDNGTGISRDEISRAFLRHSTSKISSAEDLRSVSSLGFRGEALSSIAAVAQVELVTKTHQALLGARYLIEGGEEKSLQEIGCPAGTTVIVRNLFYNTPARRKFLKTNMTEAAYISDLVQRLALSHPEISFKFTNNGQTRLHTMGNHQLRDIIYNVYGREITANILPADLQNAHVVISGYIGKPVISRGNRSYENYFINGRFIKSGIITRAIEEAYKTFIMVHKYPFTALHLRVDPELIDVNVHPAKMEVRFNNSEEIYQMVYHAVRSALEGSELIPDAGVDSEREIHRQKSEERRAQARDLRQYRDIPEPFETKRLASQASSGHPDPEISRDETSKSKRREDPLIAETAQDYRGEGQKAEQNIKPAARAVEQNTKPAARADAEEKSEKKPEQLSLFDDRLLAETARAQHRLIGQVFDTYWIVAYGDKMFIIDQHAAHEKVLYEKLVRQYRSGTPQSQYLNPPMILSLSPGEEIAVHTYGDYLRDFGFEIEPFGGREYAVRAVPMDLYGFCEKDLLLMIIDSLSADGDTGKPDVIIDRLAGSACKAAVKGRHAMSDREADALIDQLLQAENPYTCPHGRPTIISMSRYDLEKKFKRVQD